jgi:hypothetical protein
MEFVVCFVKSTSVSWFEREVSVKICVAFCPHSVFVCSVWFSQ